MDSLLTTILTQNNLTGTTTETILQNMTSLATEQPQTAEASSDSSMPELNWPWSHHRLPCTDEENASLGCAHGGVCFVIPVPGGRSEPACLCPSSYTGYRCLEKYIDLLSFSTCSESIVTSWLSIVFTGLLCTVLGVVLACLFCCFMNRRFKTKSFCSKIGIFNASKSYSQNQQHKRPLAQQISYTNYHGVRVLNNDQPIIEAIEIQQIQDLEKYNGGQEDASETKNGGKSESHMVLFTEGKDTSASERILGNDKWCMPRTQQGSCHLFSAHGNGHLVHNDLTSAEDKTYKYGQNEQVLKTELGLTEIAVV